MPAKPKSKIPNPGTAREQHAKSKMGKFRPAPEWIKELFANVIRGVPEAEPRKMFGYPCAFVNGQMLCGVFADRLMLRLSQEDRAKFLKIKDTKLFEPMPGRAMKEYVEAPPEMLKKEAELRKWLKRGLAYAKTLPPKAKKATKK